MKKEKVFGVICILLALGLALFGRPSQRIYVNALTEGVDALRKQQASMDEVLSDEIQIRPDKTDKIQEGKTYEVTVSYQIVSQKGTDLFTTRKKTGAPAYIGCSPLVTHQTFQAESSHIVVDLALALTPEEIVDEDGKPFSPQTQKLRPIVTVEPIS